MKKHIAKSIKDFSEIMDTVDFKNVDKKVKTIDEMTLTEIQKYIDFYNDEIRFNHEIVSNSTSEKEINFHQEKIKKAQLKLNEFTIAYTQKWIKQ